MGGSSENSCYANFVMCIKMVGINDMYEKSCGGIGN